MPLQSSLGCRRVARAAGTAEQNVMLHTWWSPQLCWNPNPPQDAARGQQVHRQQLQGARAGLEEAVCVSGTRGAGPKSKEHQPWEWGDRVGLAVLNLLPWVLHPSICCVFLVASKLNSLTVHMQILQITAL